MRVTTITVLIKFTYAKTPDRNVEAAEKALSLWPTTPCCGGPAGCCSAGLVFEMFKPAPASVKAVDADIFADHRYSMDSTANTSTKSRAFFYGGSSEYSTRAVSSYRISNSGTNMYDEAMWQCGPAHHIPFGF